MTGIAVGADASSLRYRAAIAELPLTAWPDPAGPVVVVDGAAGWPERLVDAADRAEALVLAEPVAVTARELEDTARSVRVPVVVERRRRAALPDRASVVAALGSAAVVEVALPAQDRDAWLRDALGWAGEVAGADAAVVAADRAAHGVLALLTGSRSIPVSLLASESAGPPLIELRTLAAERLTMRVGSRHPAVWTADAGGETRLPDRHESPERAALRRAVALLADPEPADEAEPADELARLLRDERLRAALGF